MSSKDFNKLYKEFSDYMVSYIQDHPEFVPVLQDRKRSKSVHVRFVQDLFILYTKDKNKIPWYLNNALLMYEDKSL